MANLVVDVSTSAFSAVVIWAWVLILFSSSYFELSALTQVRNQFLEKNEIRERLEGISVIAVDSETAVTEGSHPIENILDALELVESRAKACPTKRFVFGVDYVLLSGSAPDGTRKKFAGLLQNIPENLWIVWGGIISASPRTTKFLNAQVINDLTGINDKNQAFTRAHEFIGDLEVAKGSLRPGFETSEVDDAAIGFTPAIILQDKVLLSLPLAMFLLGQNSAISWETDFIEGNLRVTGGKNIEQALTSATGLSIDALKEDRLYDFFTGKNISEFSEHFLPLSELILRKNEHSPDPIGAYRAEDVRSDARETGTEYYFLAPTALPPYLGESTPGDRIVSLASLRDGFTNKPHTVDGVMAHVVGLSNLIHGNQVSVAPLPLQIAFSGIMILLSLILSVTANRIGVLVAANGLLIATSLPLSWFLFLGGIVLSLRISISLVIILAFLVALTRHFRTEQNFNQISTLAEDIFSSDQRRRFGKGNEFIKILEAPVQKEVTLLLLRWNRKEVLEPERLLNKTRDFQERAVQIIRSKGGGAVRQLDGAVLGFWGLPIESRNNTIRQALEVVCMLEIESDVDQSLVSVLARGEVIGGFTRQGSCYGYLLSGTVLDEVEIASRSTLSRISHHLLVTKTAKQLGALDQAPGWARYVAMKGPSRKGFLVYRSINRN